MSASFCRQPGWQGFFADPPAGMSLSVLLFRQGPKLRGLVPIAVRPTLTHVRVSLIGGGCGSDRVDLLAARGFEAVAADTFLDVARQTFGRKGLPAGVAGRAGDLIDLWGAIQRAGVEHTVPLALQPKEIYTLPYLLLSRNEPAAIRESPSLAGAAVPGRNIAAGSSIGAICGSNAFRAPTTRSQLSMTSSRFLRARWRGATASVLDDPQTRAAASARATACCWPTSGCG